MERVLGAGNSFLCAMDSGSPHDMKGMFGSVSQLDDDGLSGGSILRTTPTRMLWRCWIARAEQHKAISITITERFQNSYLLAK